MAGNRNQSRSRVQRDFSGGEISSRMLMRADTGVYTRSVLTMENFIPTLQGTAQRAPGSRFLLDTLVNFGRIIPYRTPLNEPAVVLFLPGETPVILDYADFLSEGGDGVPAQAEQIIRKYIIKNGFFQAGLEEWDVSPNEYFDKEGGGSLGVFWIEGINAAYMAPRIFAVGDVALTTMRTTAEVTTATERITMFYNILFQSEGTFNSGYEGSLIVGRTLDGDEVFRRDFGSELPDGTVGTRWRDVPGATYQIEDNGDPFTGTLYIKVEFKAVRVAGEKVAGGLFRCGVIEIKANHTINTTPGEVTGVAPYTAGQLKDLHFVQSPYATKRQLVVTHPEHPPYQLYFGATEYLFEPMDFGEFTPPVWLTDGNYPRTCSSFHGRLVLAGSNFEPILGQVSENPTESVWLTEVTSWEKFTDFQETVVTAKDSMEFNTIYRSPIQWVFGQKALLIGALEMEYVASAETVFQPSDIGVEMHSTHGSRAVQPVGLGKSVLFAAESGTKVRGMSQSNADEGFVAPDMTLLNPEICQSGIVRMVRMRNPHQMMVAVLGNGQLAVFHQDNYTDIAGWSRINLGGHVLDAAVQPDRSGVDILYLLIRRWVLGVPTLAFEAIANWGDVSELDYMSSYTKDSFEVPSNVITGLTQLKGKIVQVMAGDNYLGTYTVDGEGSVTLVNQIGEPLPVSDYVVGLPMTCTLTTLPAASADEGAPKRFSDVSVRTRGSTRPFINGVRPDDRSPQSLMNNSEALDLLQDLEVDNLGWDVYQFITIRETVPMRVEILGIYGNLAVGDL